MSKVPALEVPADKAAKAVGCKTEDVFVSRERNGKVVVITRGGKRLTEGQPEKTEAKEAAATSKAAAK